MVNIYIIYGTLYEDDGTTPVASATVKARNESTAETISVTTNSLGQFLFDLSNLASGWTDRDTVTIYTIYTNYEGAESVTIDTSSGYTINQDVTLSEVEDSEDINYATVQEIWDELDGKTSDDLSSKRVIRAIQWAESLINLKTGTSFKVNTETDEVHTVDRYSIETSPDYLDSINPMANLRADTMRNQVQNRVKTNRKPIIAITSLSKNGASGVEADSWTALTEQTGSGGDFIVADYNDGIIDFLNNYPRLGKRSWKLTYTWGHNPDSTDPKVLDRIKVVNRLTVLLASKNTITTKSTGSMFDSTRDVKIGSIEVKAGAGSSKTYLQSIEPEIKELWNQLEDLGVMVI